MFSVFTQQIPEQQQADGLDSSRDERSNSAAAVVIFVRASLVSPVCLFWLIIDCSLCQFVACRFRDAYYFLGVFALRWKFKMCSTHTCISRWSLRVSVLPF
jgi:hypothetical protein